MVTGSQPVDLRTGDGLALAGTLWPAPVPGRGVVVLVHGFTAGQDDPSVGALREEVGRAGYDVVTFDQRGHGDSEGLCTLGDDERHDVAAAIPVARRRPGPLVVVGASMGAIAALGAAAADRGLAGVVAVSCPARWRILGPAAALAAVMTRTGPGRRNLAARAGVRVAPRWSWPPEPRELAGRLTVPLAVVHGRDDRFIPPSEADELYRRAAGPRRLDLVPGMAHGFDPAGSAVILDAVRWAMALTPGRPAPVPPPPGTATGTGTGAGVAGAAGGERH